MPRSTQYNLTKGKTHTTGLLKLLDKVGMTDQQKREFLEGVKRQADQNRPYPSENYNEPILDVAPGRARGSDG